MFSLLSPCFVVCMSVLSLSSYSVRGETPATPESHIANDSDLSTSRRATQSVNGVRLDIASPVIMAFMGEETVLYLNYSIACDDVREDTYVVIFAVSPGDVAVLKTDEQRFIRGVCESCQSQENVTGTLNVTLSGVLPGRAILLVMASPMSVSPYASVDLVMKVGDTQTPPISYATVSPDTSDKVMWNSSGAPQPARFMIITIRKPSKLDTIFQAVMVATLICICTAMGCKTEIRVLREVWRRPVAPGIGLFCQFVAMPLIAFALTRVISFPSKAMALGFFACGCAPGGGLSNLYAYILGGDVSLSVAMTTISNIVAIGTFPMWIFTLGQVILSEDANIKIPYLNIVMSLLLIAIPLAFGVFISHKFPNFTKKLLKFILPIAVVLAIAIIAIGIYLNLYVFQMITPILFLTGALLPYIGYIFGMILSLVFRQSWKFTKTIAIETGVQNFGIAFIMVNFSLSPPDGFIAAVAPIVSSLMTPLPLLILAAVYHIYLRCFKKHKEDDSTVNPKTVSQNAGMTQQNGSAKENEAMLDRVSSV